MISIRYSSAKKPNEDLKAAPRKKNETNRQWLARSGTSNGIILLGGNSLADFRQRVAQSHLRSDLLPSYWSLVGILLDAKSFVSVPLNLAGDVSDVPRTNAVQRCSLADYDDPDLYPNIAVIRFTENYRKINESVDLLKSQRSIIDLPGLLLPWLGFVWGANQRGNPLLEGIGIPSAVFVETMYGIAGIELTPGLSSASSCPEAIWQSAKWWHEFYEQATGASDTEQTRTICPIGSFALGQPSAAVVEHRK